MVERVSFADEGAREAKRRAGERAEPPARAAAPPDAILALQRTAGNRLAGHAIARMGQALSVDRPRDPSVEAADSVREAKELVEEIARSRLYELRPHLVGRFQRLKQDVGEIAAEYADLVARHGAEPEGEGAQKRLAKLNARLNGPDLLPLLRTTKAAAETAYAADLKALDGWAPTIPDTGTLHERLTEVFAEAGRVNTAAKLQDKPARAKMEEALEAAGDEQERAAIKKQLEWHEYRAPFQPVRFLHIRRLIHSAPADQRAEAAAGSDLLDAAQRYMAPDATEVPYYQPVPNEFPEFVGALGVKQTGSVKHFDEREVDDAIRSVLGVWVARPAAAGIELPGHVTILKDRPLEAVKSAYATTLPGGGKVNAFTEGGRIFLSASGGDPSTIVHEGIHLYASGEVRRLLGDDFDEGVTEYFARIVATKGFRVTRDKYQSQYAVAAAVIGRLDEDAVARAYFAGSLEPVQGRFRILRRDLHGTRREQDFQSDWAQFCGHLKEKRYSEATAMLR